MSQSPILGHSTGNLDLERVLWEWEREWDRAVFKQII